MPWWGICFRAATGRSSSIATPTCWRCVDTSSATRWPPASLLRLTHGPGQAARRTWGRLPRPPGWIPTVCTPICWAGPSPMQPTGARPLPSTTTWCTAMPMPGSGPGACDGKSFWATTTSSTACRPTCRRQPVEPPKCPRSQRARPLTLQQLMRSGASRNQALLVAYTEGGQTMTDLARELGLSVSRVSRLIAAQEAATAKGKT